MFVAPRPAEPVPDDGKRDKRSEHRGHDRRDQSDLERGDDGVLNVRDGVPVDPVVEREAFQTILGEAFPALPARVATAVPDGRLQGWPAVPGFMRRCYGPGWALVGDAGYYKDPITTHGITDGLRDAELLADAIVDTLGGGVSEPMAMANYQSARDRMSARLFSATEAVAAYDWDTGQVRTLLRQVSAAMAYELDLLPEFVRSPGLVGAGFESAKDRKHLAPAILR